MDQSAEMHAVAPESTSKVVLRYSVAAFLITVTVGTVASGISKAVTWNRERKTSAVVSK